MNAAFPTETEGFPQGFGLAFGQGDCYSLRVAKGQTG
jgi:hypothetical protein